MPRYSFPAASSGVDVDVSKCVPFRKEERLKHTAVDGVFETLLSASGKGFLSEMLLTNQSNSNKVAVKITVDGVVVLWSSTISGTGSFCGFIQESSLSFNAYMKARVPNTNGASALLGLSMNTNPSPVFPLSTEVVDNNLVLQSPIFFKTSLLIEISSAYNADNLSLRYVGGIY